MQLTLVEKRHETLNVVSFFFKPESPVLWTPGQYLIYTLDHQNPDVRGKMRFFSISSAPFENHISITTKIDDKAPSSFKKALNELPIGGKIQAKGPDGDFVIEDPLDEYVFIAGGIGITPFRSIIADLANDKSPINITLLYSYPNEDMAFKKEFDEIAKENPNIKINYFVSPVHIDADAISEIIPDPSRPVYFISGPNNFVEGLSVVVKRLGVEEKKIKHDYFSGYDND